MSVRPLALITGASTGLGAAFARIAAASGQDLVIAARSYDRLSALAAELETTHAIVAHVHAGDLAASGGVAALTNFLESRALVPDILVNNAGFGIRQPFAATPPNELDAMMSLNMTALTMLTRAILPGMLARKRGRVLNIASTAAFTPGPFMAVYYASKAYVLSLSEALTEETRGTGVTVTCFCPGPTATEFSKRAGAKGSRLFRGGVLAVADCDTVAKAGWDAMMAGKAVAIPGLANKMIIPAARVTSRSLLRRIAGRLNR